MLLRAYGTPTACAAHCAPQRRRGRVMPLVQPRSDSDPPAAQKSSPKPCIHWYCLHGLVVVHGDSRWLPVYFQQCVMGRLQRRGAGGGGKPQLSLAQTTLDYMHCGERGDARHFFIATVHFVHRCGSQPAAARWYVRMAADPGHVKAPFCVDVSTISCSCVVA